MLQRQTQLSANIVAFCRFLREEGYSIGVREEQDALLAMQLVQPYNSPEQLQLCLQAALCRTPLQLERFPELYQHYWRELDRAVDSKTKEKEEKKERAQQRKQQKPSFQALKNWLYGNQQNDTEEVASYSDLETGAHESFPDFDEQELREIFRLVKKLVDKLANRRSRRFQNTPQKRQIDLKRTMRLNITRRDEIIQLAFRKKKKQAIRVVLLCDVSRSMALYSRFFIQFMYALQHLFPKVQTFAFSTQLKYISPELSAHSLNESVQRVIDNMEHWSGGTKIGASLEAFNQEYAHRMVDHKTLIFILSDGWDTGASELVAEQMQFLQRRAMKVIWLNPLAGSTDWAPEVAGMKAAMPYIDLLLPFHRLENIQQMIKKIR